MSDYPSYAAFVANLHTVFRIQAEATSTYELELVHVSERRLVPPYEAFSITLRGPLNAFLDQRMYSMAHEALGTLDLFIVPIAREDDGYAYEAVFNRRARGTEQEATS